MDDIDIIKAIKILAFNAVEKGEPDYVFRHIMRWYSREFHVPLVEVETIPIEDILLHFFECRYEAMSEEDLEEEQEDLCLTAAERKIKEEKKKQEAADDAAFERTVKEEAAAARAANPTPLDKIPNIDDTPIPVSVMGESLPTTFKELADSASPSMKSIPENIQMEFVSESELDNAVEDWDLLGSVPKK